MSLRYNLKDIKDWKTRCYVHGVDESVADGARSGEWIPDGTLRKETEALIFSMMAVGIGAITERNWHRVYARLHLWQQLEGASLIKDGEPYLFTPEDVYRHIGLATNVHTETDAQWRKRVIGAVVERYERAAVQWGEQQKVHEHVHRPAFVAEVERSSGTDGVTTLHLTMEDDDGIVLDIVEFKVAEHGDDLADAMLEWPDDTEHTQYVTIKGLDEDDTTVTERRLAWR